MKDALVTLGLLLGFAGLVTVHVAILFGLLSRRRSGRALGALIVPPLAPYWAFTSDMRGRAVLWIVCAVVYVAARLAVR
ncbi:Hypothetical protein A7982_11913 [Minicystis rosea]|nr:Hypothetical protein A7982_11913 [Minicystis rosea]